MPLIFSNRATTTGLLLNNLSVCDGCSVAFDSDLVPDGRYDMYLDVGNEEQLKQRMTASVKEVLRTSS